jgi:hypothetical protein
VREALDTLDRDGVVRVDKTCVWYGRGTFIGAVLRALPDVEVQSRPRIIRLRRP